MNKEALTAEQILKKHLNVSPKGPLYTDGYILIEKALKAMEEYASQSPKPPVPASYDPLADVWDNPKDEAFSERLNSAPSEPVAASPDGWVNVNVAIPPNYNNVPVWVNSNEREGFYYDGTWYDLKTSQPIKPTHWKLKALAKAEQPVPAISVEDKKKVTKIEAYGMITRVWYNEKYGYGCAECCNGDRCDEDCTAKYRRQNKNCPHCKAACWIPEADVTRIVEPSQFNKAPAGLYSLEGEDLETSDNNSSTDIGDAPLKNINTD